MQKYYTILAILLSTLSCLGDTNVNAQIKKKLHAEVKSLQADITSASKEISKLRKEKTAILKNLQDMEAWGNEQEEDKFEYYESAKQLEQKADEALAGLEKEKQASKDMQERYRFIKKLMG
jgi:phage shock protein A